MNPSDAPVVIAPIPDGFRVTFTTPFQMNTSDVEDELIPVISAKPKLVEIDLSAIGHLSTIGLGLLISLNHRIHKSGGAVRIVKLRKNILGVLQITKLDQVIQIDPNGVTG